ncbi:MAG: hypothetical protein JOZ96_16480 [Acidobacteria bacterium]|nr:hypothetical protein [Acidobacteriota bacterium]
MRYRRALLAAIPLLALAWGVLGVHSQDVAAKKELQGQTRSVVVTPNSTSNAGDHIVKPDSDNDGMPDEDEVSNGTDPNNPADADGDKDGDGLTNGDEVAGGLNVNNPDSDGDGVSDGEEVRLGFDPKSGTSTPPTNANVVAIEVGPRSLGLVINTLLGPRPAQLVVTARLSNGSSVNITEDAATSYESADASVAVVDSVGTAAGVAPGR